MESRKMVLKNLFAGQQWRNRHREQTYGHGERGVEGEMYGNLHYHMYGMGGRFKREGLYVYLWLIHVEV